MSTETPSPNLVIPPAAADAWFVCGCDEDCGRAGYQHEALPIVVAAELRRLAGEVLDNAAGLGREPGATTYAEVDTLKGVAHTLLLRADQLDPS